MPRLAPLHSVDDMTAISASAPNRRRELSRAAALLLTIGGHMLAVAILVVALAGAAVAAVAVFGPQLLSAL